MLVSVDFWKSMHGFAMDSRTRVVLRFLMNNFSSWQVTTDLRVAQIITAN